MTGRFTWPVQAAGRVLALEVVSPDTRDNDVVHKFRHYHQIGIPLYVIVDQEQEGGPQTLRGYRWTPARYEPLALDEQDRLFLEPVRLYLLLRGEEVLCQDAQTGKELGSYAEISRQLEESDRKLEEKEHLMEELIEKNRAEARERARAEEQARKAEEQAREERAEREAAQEEARKAEEQARKERAEREAAEDEVRKLKELLARLQGQPPQPGAT